MLDNNPYTYFSKLEETIENTMHKMGIDLFNLLELEVQEIEYIIACDYIKKQLLEEINNMDIGRFVNSIEFSSIRGNSQESVDMQKCNAMMKFLVPITDGLLCINMASEDDIKGIQEKLSNNDNKLPFMRHGINVEITNKLKEQLINAIKDKCKAFLHEKNFHDYKEHSLLQTCLQVIFKIYPKDKSEEIFKKIIQDIGLRIDSALIDQFMPPDIHGKQVINRTPDKSNTEEKLSQDTYILQLIQSIKEGNTEEIELCLSKIKKDTFAKILCDLFKNTRITFEDFCIVIKNSDIPDLKVLLQQMIITKGNSNFKQMYQAFTFKQVYELVKLGYLDGIELITAYCKQEQFLGNTESLDPTYVIQHLSEDALITINELKEYLDHNKFLDIYFDSKYDEFKQEIVEFYKLYILSEKNSDEIAEFQENLLADKKLSAKKIMDLWELGFISNDKLKEIKGEKEELNTLLQKYIKKLYSTQQKESYNFIFGLLYDGLVSQNDLITILGQEVCNDIICVELSNKNNDLKPTNIEKLQNLGFIKPYEEIQNLTNYETEILYKENISPEEILKYYSAGFISNSTIKELKKRSQEFKSAIYDIIKSQYHANLNVEVKKIGISNIIYFIQQGIIDEFELIDILGDGEFENFIRSGLENRVIQLADFKYFSFIDEQLLCDMYEAGNIVSNKSSNAISFNYLLQAYLSGTTISLDRIESIISLKEDSDFKASNFNNLSNYIYQAIQATPNVNVEKIKELYLRNYLIFSDLSKLIDEGIISSEEAKEINEMFCSDKIFEIRQFDTTTLDLKAKKGNPSDCDSPANPKKQAQAEMMLDTMKRLGYLPKIQNDSSAMSTFKYGPLKNYRIFISNENPSVIILMHLLQQDNTNTYYKGRENKTYVVPTSDFYNYLTASDSGLGLSAEQLLEQPSIITVRISKTWTQDLQKGLTRIESMLAQTTLTAHSLQGERAAVVENAMKARESAAQTSQEEQ